MKYVAIKRYKRPELPGPFGRSAANIPYGADLEERGGKLHYKGLPVCNDHSAVMREYFARNDDGQGLLRGKLSRAIVQTLEIRKGETKEQHNARWDVVWNDPLCLKYRKQAQADFFLWSIEFFNAPIEDLSYIAGLVGAKIKAA